MVLRSLGRHIQPKGRVFQRCNGRLGFADGLKLPRAPRATANISPFRLIGRQWGLRQPVARARGERNSCRYKIILPREASIEGAMGTEEGRRWGDKIGDWVCKEVISFD